MINIIEELGMVEWSGQRFNTVIVKCNDCDYTRKIKKTRLVNKKIYRCRPCSCRINGQKGAKKIKEKAALLRSDPEEMERRKANLRKMHNKASAKYKAKNKVRIDDYHYIKNYGMTKKEALELKKQGCFICGSKKRVVIDHDHNTNKVRGVLCDNHNKGFGLLGDTYDDVMLSLEKLKIYLEKHVKETRKQTHRTI